MCFNEQDKLSSKRVLTPTHSAHTTFHSFILGERPPPFFMGIHHHHFKNAFIMQPSFFHYIDIW